MINERTCYDALDDIVDNTVLSNYKKKVIQNTIVEVSSDTRTVSVDGVSALPTVGSDFQTGLSTAVGREDRYSLSSGNILDKVDHVAGQLKVRTVPVEDLLLFSAVYFVMPSLLRSLTVQTSTFFLSDGREEVKRPLSIRTIIEAIDAN